MRDHGVTEQDYLTLSGIQHYAFCPRQWALIYVEQQWADNERTVDGSLMPAAPTTKRCSSAGAIP